MNKIITIAMGAMLGASSLAAQNTGRILTWTRVNQPWYAPNFLVRSKMKDSVPEYKAIPGLVWKSYSIEASSNRFGGIYLWESESSAKAWFNEAWFERVKSKYGETQVPLLKVVWSPEGKELTERREKSSFAEVHSFVWKEKEYSVKYWEALFETAKKEKNFLAFVISKDEKGEGRIFSFWSDEPEGTEIFLNNLSAKQEGKVSIPIHITNI